MFEIRILHIILNIDAKIGIIHESNADKAQKEEVPKELRFLLSSKLGIQETSQRIDK